MGVFSWARYPCRDTRRVWGTLGHPGGGLQYDPRAMRGQAREQHLHPPDHASRMIKKKLPENISNGGAPRRHQPIDDAQSEGLALVLTATPRYRARQATSERSGNHLQGFKNFYLKAKTRIWP